MTLAAAVLAVLLTDPEVLVSRHLAEDRQLTVGGTIQLSADPRGGDPRPFRVAGIYEPLPDPFRFTARRHEIRLHLPDLVQLTADPTDPQAAEAVGALNVALVDPADAEAFGRDLQARMPGLVVAASSSDGELFRVLERFHQAIAAVTVLGSTAFLLALMVMRAEERREVAGILRLLGFSRGRILQQVLLEGLLLAGAGAVFGVGVAAATQGIVNAFFQWRYDTALVFVRVTWPLALRCVALAVPLGIGAGLVASWGLLREEPHALVRR